MSAQEGGLVCLGAIVVGETGSSRFVPVLLSQAGAAAGAEAAEDHGVDGVNGTWVDECRCVNARSINGVAIA